MLMRQFVDKDTKKPFVQGGESYIRIVIDTKTGFLWERGNGKLTNNYSVQELVDKFHELSPSEFYYKEHWHILGWKEETQKTVITQFVNQDTKLPWHHPHDHQHIWMKISHKGTIYTVYLRKNGEWGRDDYIKLKDCVEVPATYYTEHFDKIYQSLGISFPSISEGEALCDCPSHVLLYGHICKAYKTN